MGFVVLTEAEETENLNAVVSMLNDDSGPEADWNGKRYTSEDAIRLRRLVRAWRETESNPRKMKLGHDETAKLNRFVKGMQPHFDLAKSELLVVDYYSQPYDEAALQFTRLLYNKQNYRLGGPCPSITHGEVCGKWFVRVDKRGQGKFCPRPAPCAANAAKVAERQRDRQKKLNLARMAIRNYETGGAAKYSMDWKEYVLQALEDDEELLADAEATPLSKSFLTRAVNSGELEPPELRELTANAKK